MSSTPILQKPYVLASLPRPLDASNGRYVVGNVYGWTGSKKRKRSELAVGIDGEGVNLYDISSAKLITSYAIPPQSSFTCPPCSLRIRASKNRVERKTYVSAKAPQPQITIFHDVTEGSDGTKSTTNTVNLANSSLPIVFAGTVTARRDVGASSSSQDLVVVTENGEIQCFDGDSLEVRWTSPASALKRATSNPNRPLIVEYTQIITASAARQGLLRGRQDLLAVLPQGTSEGGFDHELLFIVTSSKTDDPVRTLHVVDFPRLTNGLQAIPNRSVQSLLAMTLPCQDLQPEQQKLTFNLHASSGLLQQLCGNLLTTFDLTNTFPKKVSELYSTDARSFVRISSTSIMVSTPTSVSVYNPKYQSLMGNLSIEAKEAEHLTKRKRSTADGINGIGRFSLEVLAYFQNLDTVVAIKGHDLIAIEVKGQHDRPGKESGVGLLIDALGRSAKEGNRRVGRLQETNIGLSTMNLLVSTSEQKAEKGLHDLQSAFSEGDTAGFDSLIAEKFGEGWITEDAMVTKSKVEGLEPSPIAKKNESKLADKRMLTDMDRRWVLYLLSLIFTLTKTDDGEPQLSVTFYPSTTFMWLIRTGNMTKFNVESALRRHKDFSLSESLSAEALLDAIIDFDRDMDLLLALLTSTPLDAAELLYAIRTLMESLGLFGDNQDAAHGLLADGEAAASSDEDVDREVERLEKEAEEDLQLAEYQLGPGSGVRGQALTLALSKLYTCPDSATLSALQTTFSSHEIVSLIYLLRFELARGAWTSRYLDSDQSGVIDEEADIPDHAIVLISSLLNNCIDAVGAGGWLAGDAKLLNKDPFEAEELITSLKLEVSAALEGIEEAVYLKGLTSEMIRYGDLTHNHLPKPVQPEPELPAGKRRKVLKKPVVFAPLEQDFKTLPLGLKPERRISKLRVGAGGEVQERSARDIGRLKSHQVGKYSLERIVV